MSLLERILKNSKINYNCSFKSLKTLSKNIPKKIEGDFNCKGNYLTSLEGCPKIVTGDFDCSENYLTLLEGIPEEINGDLNISNNKLTSLSDCSKIIKGNLICEWNPELKNIKEQIIKYQIKAKRYIIDVDDFAFDFEEIKEEFEKYGNFLIQQKKLKEKKELLKQKLKENIKENKKKLNQNDYGLGI